MRASFRALALAGALTTMAALLPLTAQSDVADANDDAAGPAVVSDADVKKSLTEIRNSWRDFNTCDRSDVCSAYFDTFGVALTFADGSIAPFSHLRRRTLSAHDCIVNARAALEQKDRGLAVQWVMASQAVHPLLRAWMGDHPDAVIAALNHCCF
ncbi:MAG TPA: hypothetical protein VI653_08805 [Steroidobacteraceae bacterium]